jgi:hypothetical protein
VMLLATGACAKTTATKVDSSIVPSASAMPHESVMPARTTVPAMHDKMGTPTPAMHDTMKP